MTFGQKLKKLRKEKQLGQKEFAELFSLSKSSIAMYEVDKALPSPETIRRFAEYFNVTSDYLLGLSNVENFANLPLEIYKIAEYIHSNGINVNQLMNLLRDENLREFVLDEKNKGFLEHSKSLSDNGFTEKALKFINFTIVK